jgi:hypothetical protein
MVALGGTQSTYRILDVKSAGSLSAFEEARQLGEHPLLRAKADGQFTTQLRTSQSLCHDLKS